MNVRQSATLDKLAPALLKAQQACVPPTKDKTNPHFKSKYADLESVRLAMFEAFAANGLAVMQMPSCGEGAAVVINRLLHTSGEWIEWEGACPMAKNDPQGWRGAITYIRRTSLEGVANLAAEDDDGNTAAQQPKPKAETTPAVKRAALKESQKDWFYSKAKGDAELVHRCVAKITGRPCTRAEWPSMSVEEHGRIGEAIDVALEDARP